MNDKQHDELIDAIRFVGYELRALNLTLLNIHDVNDIEMQKQADNLDKVYFSTQLIDDE